MKIVLIADTEKNELLGQFCAAQQEILSRQELYATAITAKWVENASGLPVRRLLCADQGGYQQIAAYVAYGEADMVIFLRDPQASDRADPDEMHLLSMCDKRGVPVATNIAAAELLVRAMKRDAQGWHEVLSRIHP